MSGFNIGSIIASLKLDDQLTVQLQTVAKKSGEAIKGMAKELGKMAIEAVGVAEIVKQLRECRDAAIEAEKVEAQLDAVLKSQGRSSDETAEALKRQASAMSRLSIFSDTQIEQAQIIALKYTHIGGEVFPKLTQAAIDMASRTGGDVSSAMQQMAASINDPIAGITRLRAQGVALDDSQIKLIKRLTYSGQTAKAQSILLDELGKGYAGAGAAARNTAAGAMTAWDVAVKKMHETLGKDTTGPLKDLYDLMTKGMYGIIDNYHTAIGVIYDMLWAVTDTYQKIGDFIISWFVFMSDKMAWIIEHNPLSPQKTKDMARGFVTSLKEMKTGFDDFMTSYAEGFDDKSAAQRDAQSKYELGGPDPDNKADPLDRKSELAKRLIEDIKQITRETRIANAGLALLMGGDTIAHVTALMAAAAKAETSDLGRKDVQALAAKIEAQTKAKNAVDEYVLSLNRQFELEHQQVAVQAEIKDAITGVVDAQQAAARQAAVDTAIREKQISQDQALTMMRQLEAKDAEENLQKYALARVELTRSLDMMKKQLVATQSGVAVGTKMQAQLQAEASIRQKLTGYTKQYQDALRPLITAEMAYTAAIAAEQQVQDMEKQAAEATKMAAIRRDQFATENEYAHAVAAAADEIKKQNIQTDLAAKEQIALTAAFEDAKDPTFDLSAALVDVNKNYSDLVDRAGAAIDAQTAAAQKEADIAAARAHTVVQFQVMAGTLDQIAEAAGGADTAIGGVASALAGLAASFAGMAAAGIKDWGSLVSKVKAGGADAIAAIVGVVNSIGQMMKTMNVGGSNKQGGQSQFGARMDSNYAGAGAIVGTIVGAVIGAIVTWAAGGAGAGAGAAIGGAIGTVLGAMISKAGDSASAALVNGQIKVGESSAKLDGAILDALRNIWTTVGDTLASLGLSAINLPTVDMKIRDNVIRVIVGEVQRTFSSMADAMSFAIAESIKQAQFSGNLSTEVAAALKNTVAETMEQLNSDIAFAMKIANYGLPKVVSQIDKTVAQFFVDMRRAAALGIDTAKVGQMFVDQMNAMKNEILGIDTAKDPKQIMQENIDAYNNRVALLQSEAALQIAEQGVKALDIQVQIDHLKNEISLLDTRATLYAVMDKMMTDQLTALQANLAAINANIAAEQVILSGLTPITPEQAQTAINNAGNPAHGGGGRGGGGGNSLADMIRDENLRHSQIGMSDFQKQLDDVNRKWDEATKGLGDMGKAEAKAAAARDKAIDAAKKSGKTQEEIDKAIKAANDRYAEQIKHIHRTTAELNAANAAREQEIADIIAQQQKDVNASYNEFMGIGQDPLSQLTTQFNELVGAITAAQYPAEQTAAMIANVTAEYNRQIDALIAMGREQAVQGVQGYLDAARGIGPDQRGLMDMQAQFQEARENLFKVAEAARLAGKDTGWLIGAIMDLDAAQKLATRQLGVQFVQSLHSLGAAVPTKVMRELAHAQWELAKVQAINAAIALAAAGGFEGLSFSLQDVLGWINNSKFELSDFFPKEDAQSVADSMNDAANAAKELADRFAKAQDDIRKLLIDMAGGQFGVVTARSAFEFAQNRYNETMASAKAGNIGALESISDVSRDYLKQLASFSPAMLSAAFPGIQQDLGSLLDLKTAKDGNVLTSVLFQQAHTEQLAATTDGFKQMSDINVDQLDTQKSQLSTMEEMLKAQQDTNAAIATMRSAESMAKRA